MPTFIQELEQRMREAHLRAPHQRDSIATTSGSPECRLPAIDVCKTHRNMSSIEDEQPVFPRNLGGMAFDCICGMSLTLLRASRTMKPRRALLAWRDDDMKGRTMFALFAAGAMLASGSAASAQGGRYDTPREGACFYEDANYRGQYFCAQAGDDLSRLPSGANDRVSSIRLFGGAEVTIFDNVQFRGGSLRITSDVRNLTDEGFNDRVSSIQVENRYARNGNWGSRSSSNDSRNVDRVIRRAYEDVLQREPDAQGMRLYRSRMIDDGWSEQQVREALRTSPENRQQRVVNRDARAQEIVRRAYLSVLNREPDAGSRGYVDRVLRDNWTQQDVERELRKSPEYRGR